MIKFLAALAGLLLVGMVSGQTGGASFDVASVKPVDDARAVSVVPHRSGNRISYVTMVDMAIYYAYRVQPFQVSGDLPGDVYDIEAEAEGSPGEDQIRIMLQRLLAERFQLRLHREARTMQVFELGVAKGKPKLKPDDGKQAATPGVGAWAMRDGAHLVSKNGTMTQLADTLARLLKAPVADRTGLRGGFDFDVRYNPDVLQERPGSTTDPLLPSLETAIGQELGLKLTRGKGPVEVLVIDHVARPSEN